MTAEEVDGYFARINEPPPLDEHGEPVQLPTRPLHDTRNLHLWNLMRQYKGYPNVQVFAQPVELWPSTRHEDFTTLMLAESKVRYYQDQHAEARTELQGMMATEMANLLRGR